MTVVPYATISRNRRSPWRRKRNGGYPRFPCPNVHSSPFLERPGLCQVYGRLPNRKLMRFPLSVRGAGRGTPDGSAGVGGLPSPHRAGGIGGSRMSRSLVKYLQVISLYLSRFGQSRGDRKGSTLEVTKGYHLKAHLHRKLSRHWRSPRSPSTRRSLLAMSRINRLYRVIHWFRVGDCPVRQVSP